MFYSFFGTRMTRMQASRIIADFFKSKRIFAFYSFFGTRMTRMQASLINADLNKKSVSSAFENLCHPRSVLFLERG